MSFFQALKDKTTELKEKTKARLGVATVKGKQQRDNVESIAGVDKARERHAQSTKPPGEGSTATRHGAFSGAATAATSLSAAFSKIGSSPYKKKGDERIVEYTEDASAGSSTQAPAEKHAEGDDRTGDNLRMQPRQRGLFRMMLSGSPNRPPVEKSARQV